MRSQLHLSALALILAGSFGATSASAFQQPRGMAGALELADGGQVRQLRTFVSQPPSAARGAIEAFRRKLGGSWVTSWDGATGVPARIFGSGVSAPGTVASETLALRFSRDFLAQHIALLAPGASVGDFELSANEKHGAMRIVAFVQRHRGLEVLGGQLSFRFKNDRLFVIASEALPHVSIDAVSRLLSSKAAKKRATRWIAAEVDPMAVAREVAKPLILPLVGQNGVQSYRVVRRVNVSTAAPIGRWAVYLDAKTGEPVAREQTLRFATGSLRYNTAIRFPNGERDDFPARFAEVTVNGSPVTSDANGMLTFPDNLAEVTVKTALKGPFVTVTNEGGDEASATLQLTPGSNAVWNASSDPKIDAQLNGFIHAHIAKDFARALAPDIGWLDAELPVHVNHDNSCNAYYDGSSINFFSQSDRCENTGRLPDVVYHEFGHGLHHHAIVAGAGGFDSALSEGVSDYFAATLTDDPAMGRGFFFDSKPLRHIDPSDGERVWPDNIHSDPHETGLIIAGALWDLRKLLVTKHGKAPGSALADQLFLNGMRTAADIPSMYVEVLAADDDDGDLANGTPNVCEIVRSFGQHGLRVLNVAHADLSLEPPATEGHLVTTKVEGLYEQCEGDRVTSANLNYALQRFPDEVQTVSMDRSGAEFSAMIAPQEAGEVVRFSLELQLEDSKALTYPDNPADPTYQFFVGSVEPIYCTDFEEDPLEAGWVHGLSEGTASEGADDWQWGVPNGEGQNGDPGKAFSGIFSYGNDLGTGNFNGLYQPNKINFTDSPVIDVSGYANVRLQYRRWLSVEDGFFDRASIYVGGKLAWQNFASTTEAQAQIHHRDREWRFHDLDITKFVSSDDKVQIRYEIASDPGFELGGWTIDDFCVVGYKGHVGGSAVCGNGQLELGEACDDGNTEPGDGCDAQCQAEPQGNEAQTSDQLVAAGGCLCEAVGGNTGQPGPWRYGVLAAAALGLTARRRRRR